MIKAPEVCSSMAEVRAGVDEVDRQIVALIAQRFGYMDAAARIKQERAEVRDEARKAEVLRNVQMRATELGLKPELLAQLYDRLIEASIAYEFGVFDAARTTSNDEPLSS